MTLQIGFVLFPGIQQLDLRGVSYDGLDRSIDVAISRLRRKLYDNTLEPFRIKTVRNKGYLFAPNAWESLTE